MNTQKTDPEVAGMSAAFHAIKAAPYEARGRMREWLNARFDWEDRQVRLHTTLLREINGDGWQNPKLST